MVVDELAPISERIPNGKHRLFIDELFKCNMNQTQAYLNVYGSDYDTARVNASKLLTKTNISEEVERRLNESAMTANEVLARLAAMARGNMGDFLDFKDGVRYPFIDLNKARESGLLPLVKKFKYDKDGHIEFELYDAQAALVQIGKAHGLFVDRNEIDVSGNMQQWLQALRGTDDG